MKIIFHTYEVHGSIDPIKSAQYVSRAEYALTMVSKEKKMLQHCLYDAVS